MGKKCVFHPALPRFFLCFSPGWIRVLSKLFSEKQHECNSLFNQAQGLGRGDGNLDPLWEGLWAWITRESCSWWLSLNWGTHLGFGHKCFLRHEKILLTKLLPNPPEGSGYGKWFIFFFLAVKDYSGKLLPRSDDLMDTSPTPSRAEAPSEAACSHVPPSLPGCQYLSARQHNGQFGNNEQKVPVPCPPLLPHCAPSLSPHPGPNKGAATGQAPRYCSRQTVCHLDLLCSGKPLSLQIFVFKCFSAHLIQACA